MLQALCAYINTCARAHTHTQHTHSIETRPIYCAHKFQVQFLFWDKTVCLLLFVNFISRHAHAAYCTTILCTVFSVEQTNTTQLTAVSRSQLTHNIPPHSCIMYTRGGQRWQSEKHSTVKPHCNSHLKTGYPGRALYNGYRGVTFICRTSLCSKALELGHDVLKPRNDKVKALLLLARDEV